MIDNIMEQLCIKKGLLKELECMHCKGYDLTCPSYEEIENNNQQTNSKSSDSEDAMFLAKELNEFPTALHKVKTAGNETDARGFVDNNSTLKRGSRNPSVSDNPLEEELYLQRHKYTTEEI